MLVFATETSCDETSICVMEDRRIVEHVIFSQEIHNKYGGVVPELASRSHLDKLQEITMNLLQNTSIDLSKVDAYAATCGPGLIGSLLVGATFTKSLSLINEKPFYPINHLEGHILSTSFNNVVKYPSLILLLTGGHTEIYLMKDPKRIKLLGGSVDDAIGEAFDKTAKILGLSYPGGAEIELRAKEGDENSYKLPKPLINENNFNFSFSGLKTHISLLTKKNLVHNEFISNICASFQKTVTEIIISKINNGLKILEEEKVFIKSISVVGGVSNNLYIRRKLEKLFEKEKIELYYPIKEMMSDNAAMIAWACLRNYDEKNKDIFFRANPRLRINE